MQRLRIKETILRVAMTLVVMLFTTASAWATITGSGTQEDPYIISSKADWNAATLDSKYYTEGVYVELGGDIDFGNNNCNRFEFCNIHFDGKGHTIRNFKVDSSTETYVAPFKALYQGGTISNLTIANSILTGYKRVAGIVAVNQGVVSNCHVESSVTITAKVSDSEYCGGIAACNGWNNGSTTTIGTIINCTVGANFVLANRQNQPYFGGIVGRNYGASTVSGCLCYSTNVSSVNYFKILVGSYSSNGDNITNNYYRPVGSYDHGAPSATVVRAVNGIPSGVTVSPAVCVSHSGYDYIAENTSFTLTIDDANKIFSSFSVSGATYSVAADRKSATVTLATSDATVSTTLVVITGSCGDNATWSISDTNSDGTYEKLTISGTGRIAPYENGTAPWYADFHSTITNLVIDNGIEMIQESDFYGLTAITEVTLPASVYYIAQNAFEGCSSLARVNIKKTDGVVTLFSSNAFNGCHSSLVIVVPTPALALQYIDNEDWTAYASKIRANLGGYAFRIDGTTASDAAYQIADADDLRRLANAVNAGNGTATSGQTFRQTADIDLGGTNFPIIGDTFRGTYDGQGFAISGLSVSTNRITVGLFGYIDGATLRGITLVQPSVTTSSPNNNLTCDVGAIVGYAYKSTIENCHALQPTVSATGTGSGAKRIGAIAGETDNSSRLTNCCYYGGNAAQAMGYGNATLTRVGRARKVTLGSGIATVSPALTGGDGSNGFRYDGTDYYREGVALTLTSDVATTAGYTLTYSANSTAISGSTYTVNSTDGDVTLTAAIRSDGQQHEVTYVDADGTEHPTQAIALDGTETSLGAGTYFVGLPTVSFDHTLYFTGNADIILADGCIMNVGTSDARINGMGIISTNNLTIYGQALGSGHLNVYSTCTDNAHSNSIDISGDLTLNSGNVTVRHYGDYGVGVAIGNSFTVNGGSIDATSNQGQAIYANGGNITINDGSVTTDSGMDDLVTFHNIIINGGTVNATGDISAGGTITLGWTKPTDRIYASSYSGTVKVADGKMLTDGSGNILTGTLTANDINGKTLYPYIENLDLTANAVDGNYWTTFYCGHTGYKIDNEENACAYTATVANSTITLHKLGKVIPAGTAVIIVGADSEISMTASTDAAEYPVSNNLRGVDIRTEKSTLGTGTFYVLSKKNDAFGFFEYTGAYMPARKAYLLLSGTEARSLTMVFEGETTAISDALRLNDKGQMTNDNFYDLQGRKIEKPTKGLYIHNGKKVVIK